VARCEGLAQDRHQRFIADHDTEFSAVREERAKRERVSAANGTARALLAEELAVSERQSLASSLRVMELTAAGTSGDHRHHRRQDDAEGSPPRRRRQQADRGLPLPFFY